MSPITIYMMIHTPTACQLIHCDLKGSVVYYKRSVIRGFDTVYFGVTDGHLTGKAGLFQSRGSVFAIVLPAAVTHGYFPDFEILATDGTVVPVKGWCGEGHVPVDLHQGRWATVRQNQFVAGFQVNLSR